MQQSGQRACSLYAKVREQLQRERTRQSDRLSHKVLAKLDLLLSRLAQHASPLRPLGVFSIDRATAVSLAGVILTYMVVLLQFKVGDVGTVEYYAGRLDRTNVTTE